MGYLYKKQDKPRGPYTVVDLFSGGKWRFLALAHDFLYFLSVYLWTLFRLLRYLLLVHTMEYCLGPGDRKTLSFVWWMAYMLFSDLPTFEQDYLEAWNDRHARYGPAESVLQVPIFCRNDSMCVPILFDKLDAGIGNDRMALENLRMWYCWMKMRRGISEAVLPRRLVKIYKVYTCKTIEGTFRLGARKRLLELGRNAHGHAANFENPEDVREDQREQMEKYIAVDLENEGIEFVETWDAVAVSAISMTPFVLSLVFGCVWTSVSIQKYGVDAQVATQTAFTVASYIVTAGALLIALFAFLDSVGQVNETP